ncbi:MULTISPECIES: hypothetical protein [unclassified Leptospira]|uniref:hypothetical protein n=2 Tax=Leptospira TaxID=171 RepID=UPI0002BF6DC9|nr:MULTISPECIES: hypothetical protein [unclassified Leptospira]EMJ99439.1 hypothetical protein LEP1GSC192_3005 [Leptospira sp. B5-022]MCR1792291.1 hypothetical protein [Leptospira sp. id769339]
MLFKISNKGGIRVVTAYLCLFFSMNISVIAHEEGAPHSHTNQCREDKEKYCKEIPKGDILSCLKKNEENLSEECRELLQEVRNKARMRMEACKEEKEKYCSDRGTAVIRCLQENKNVLGEKCKSTLFSASK